MVYLKEFLAFPLYASMIWLLWVLIQQNGHQGIIVSGLGLLSIAFYAWIYPKLRSIFFKTFILLGCGIILVMTFIFAKPEPKSISQQIHPMTFLKQYIQNQQPVFVEVTASWCITCQLNKISVLNRDVVKSFFHKNNIQVVILDWTQNDDQITQFLASFNRKGVPLYLYYPPGSDQPRILPQLLTVQNLLEELQK
jgi:thiol:disulfide interchange protein DsbD